jgi:tetratricopeptide (TPR) repeat protein
VTHFEDAAKLYKLCKAYEKQINCLKLAVECNEKLNDNWAVARNYEAIIQSWIENNPELNVQELIDITRRSGIYFKAADSAHNTLNLYVKVAKYLMQKKNNKEAEELIIEALQEAEEQQVPSTRIDILNQYVEILMQTSRYYFRHLW